MQISLSNTPVFWSKLASMGWLVQLLVDVPARGACARHIPRGCPESARARRLSRCQLSEMLADIPRPEFDHMAAGVRHISGAPSTMAVPPIVVVKDRIASLSKPIDNRVVGLSRQPHRVVDVDATAPSAQSDLGSPQADSRSVRGHHPNRLVGPSLDHRKSQDTRIEFLGRGQIVLLERELGHPTDRNCVIAAHDVYFLWVVTKSMPR